MSLYDLDFVTIDGTPQYEGLQALYGKSKDRGFVVFGLPVIEVGLCYRHCLPKCAAGGKYLACPRLVCTKLPNKSWKRFRQNTSAAWFLPSLIRYMPYRTCFQASVSMARSYGAEFAIV